MATTVEHATEKHLFNAPSDMLEKGVKALAATTMVAPGVLVGTWTNCDHHTRSLVRLVIATAGTGISIHAFGACTPTPCDWGTATAKPYAANVSSTGGIAFTAQYNFAFKQTIIVGRVDMGMLTVELFDHFTDNSGRSDYYSIDYMSQ